MQPTDLRAREARRPSIIGTMLRKPQAVAWGWARPPSVSSASSASGGAGNVDGKLLGGEDGKPGTGAAP